MNKNFELFYNYLKNNNDKININLITNNIFYIETKKIIKCQAKYLNFEFNNNFEKIIKENSNFDNLPFIYNILYKILENVNNINKLIYLYESDYFIIFNNKECYCKCKNMNNINTISNVSICIDINEILIQINKENSFELILKTLKSCNNNDENKENSNEPLWNIICNL